MFSRIVGLCLAGFSPMAHADFTLVMESTASPSQTSSVSVRGNTLRVSVKTNDDEVVLLRNPEWALTAVTKEAKQVVIPDRPLSPNAGPSSLSYRFVSIGKTRVVLGRTCEEFTAVASNPVVSFAGCFAPWKEFGIDVQRLASGLPNATTLGYHPELLQLTMSWTKMGPVFLGQLPGVPLELTAFFFQGPTSTVSLRAVSLSKKALDPSLFARPPSPPSR